MPPPKDPEKYKKYIENQRKSRIGKPNPCKTLEIALLRKERMSYAAKKLWQDPAYRSKTQSSMKKKKLSEDHKKKIGMKFIGDSNPMKNPEFAAKCVASNTGKPKSKEHCEKISANRQGIPYEEWTGKITPLYHEIRYCTKYYEWRTEVFERDNYCDWFSGVKGNGNLNAHHVIPFSELLKQYNIKSFEQAIGCEALWNVDNGVTMIDTNHSAYHSMWG
jgi:hypothetical protein